MSKFFLNNQAICANNYELFERGSLELIAIEKIPEHIFYKHTSFYSLNVYSELCTMFSYERQEILRYFEQMSCCEKEIVSEEDANSFCASDINGFLGIDFSHQNIPVYKQIINDESYRAWIQYYASNYDKLINLLGNYKVSEYFRKAFIKLSKNIQVSIIEEFQKAEKRNLITRFFPDTKIIKDVSLSKKCTILELRVYSPVALRVYFNEINNCVYLASIEQKSNPNQNEDIKNAEKLLGTINP